MGYGQSQFDNNQILCRNLKRSVLTLLGSIRKAFDAGVVVADRARLRS
jgi:hypothetical protein